MASPNIYFTENLNTQLQKALQSFQYGFQLLKREQFLNSDNS